MTLSSKLIRNNYTVQVAILDVDGTPGQIVLKQTKSDVWNDLASVMVRLKGEKQVCAGKVNTRKESLTPEDLDTFIETGFITEWVA